MNKKGMSHELMDVISDILDHSESLTKWEIEFTEDQQDRLSLGNKLSQNQKDKLFEIWERYCTK